MTEPAVSFDRFRLPTDSCVIRSNDGDVVFVVGIEHSYDPEQECTVQLTGSKLVILQGNIELVRLSSVSARACQAIRDARTLVLINVRRPGRRDETISFNPSLMLQGE